MNTGYVCDKEPRNSCIAAIDFYVTGAPWLNRWFGKNAIS
jgi:hypothetical protein